MDSKLTKAFKLLRKNGYIARRNFMCCDTCAWAELEDKGEKAVFFNQQSRESYNSGGSLYLAWSGNGYEIAGILATAGIDVEWNGEGNRKIMINNY